MAVIINDFEIVSEPPPSEERGSGDQHESQAAQAQDPKPHEIEHVVERQRERRARVWAH